MNNDIAITDCNCLALRQAARTVSALYDRHLAPTGLGGAQFSILAAIKANPGIGMQDLSDLLVMDRTSLVRAVQPLARDGFVLQQPDPGHARKLVLTLSAQGRAKYDEAHPHWRDAQREFEGGVGAPQAAALRQDLAVLSRKR
jgi:DNA-binding MarR family transcriptional regulator